MLFSSCRIAVISLALVLLTGFRMPAKEEPSEGLLYDVRGAFVTARPDVSGELITQTDILIDSAIQSTSRSFILPRAILTVRISEAKQAPALFGMRHSAVVTVKAISVGSGDAVAEGSFEASVVRFGKEGADAYLAERIAERISAEFQLVAPRRRAAMTAFVERR